MRNQLIIRALLLVLVIFILNTLAMYFYWYVSIPWLDIPMHFLGGVFIAFVMGAVFFKKTLSFSFSKKLLVILSGVLVLGIVWELFEFSVFTVVKFVEPNSPIDTATDLVLDLVGGIVGVYFVSRAQNRYNKSLNGEK